MVCTEVFKAREHGGFGSNVEYRRPATIGTRAGDPRTLAVALYYTTTLQHA